MTKPDGDNDQSTTESCKMRFPRYAKTEEEILMDQEANAFAYGFLLPRLEFIARFHARAGNMTLLAEDFKISKDHAKARAQQLGLLQE